MSDLHHMDDLPCTCLAFDEEDGFHLQRDHIHDCGSQPPCGGCWGCLSATVYCWNKRKAEHPEEGK